MEDSRMEICHYENLRKRNLEGNKVMLASLMSDFKEHIVKKPSSKTVWKKKRTSTVDIGESFIRRNPSRHARVAPTRFDLPYARPRPRSGSISSTVSSSSSTPSSTPEKLVVRFGFFKKSISASSEVPKYEPSDEDEDEDDEDIPLPKTTRQPKFVSEYRSVEDITEADLNMVAERTSEKHYDSEYGTSCHQCRQKTNDMKTVCRSDHCIGVRGQFCGPCLKNRYGEDAKEALLSQDWKCPPCRGICNCSFCRKKSNKSATGILIHLAKQRGYSDVNSFLRGQKESSN